MEFNYEQFKNLIVRLLAEVREKIKISEDDIKTLFFILDHEKYGAITKDNIKELKNLSNISMRLKEFYKSRINKDMVKVTHPLCRIPSLNWEKLRITPSKSIKSKTRLFYNSKT